MASLIGHEIAHSWTGNLVTNKNFEHFWLNEGFTTFTERKIEGRLYGELYRHFKAIGGWKDLAYAVRNCEKKLLLKTQYLSFFLRWKSWARQTLLPRWWSTCQELIRMTPTPLSPTRRVPPSCGTWKRKSEDPVISMKNTLPFIHFSLLGYVF